MTAAFPSIPTQDERVMAALSHGAIIIPTWGIIVPIIVWLTQKDKSRYVAFQALQAIALHALELLVMMLFMACYFATFIPFFVSLSRMESTGGPPDAFFLMMGILLVYGLALAAFSVTGLIGAVQTFRGKDFRYPLLGSWVASRSAR